ncbi:MAG: hypothetical protein ABI634_18785 [Acidobacteriota bacterium]
MDDISASVDPLPKSGAPTFFGGHATLGGATPSVATTYASAFANAGYDLPVSGIAANRYRYMIYSHLTTGYGTCDC